MSVRLAPAADVPHADRATLWNEAFSDYFSPASFTAESLAGFEKAFDLDLTGSRIALEDERPVAFAMLGVRDRSGWVGGMGVIPSARRRGFGDCVMNGILEAARERGLETLRLEVLVQNEPAIPLYQRLGYRTVRQLEVWDRAADAAAPAAPDPAQAMPIERARRFLEAARTERAPWQRELGPALAAFPDMQALASDDATVVAVFRATPERIGLLDLAAAPGAPRETRGRGFDAVLATLFASHPSRSLRLLNLPEGDPAGPALARAGASVSHRQWEMERPV